MKLLIVIVFLSLLYCTNKRQLTEEINPQKEGNIQFYKINEFTLNIEQNYEKPVVIGKAIDLVVQDSGLILHDEISLSIYKYDLNGKFLFEVGKRG